MPWFTLPTLEWLKSIDISQWKVFEYGAGYSTVWFRLNCKEVISIDSNEAWAQAMLAWFEDDKTKYIHSIANEKTYGELYDLIVVDGSWREECVNYCLDFLKPGGYLIIDNFGQEDYPQDAVDRTLKLLEDWPVEVHKQPNHSKWCTAVFQKPE
jgi:predicted O-methyltransferase YrrM